MSRTYQQPLTPSSQASSTPSSKLKEHLAVAVPPAYPPVERSRFSPDSPERAFSFGGSTLRMFSPRSRPLDLEKGPAGLPASQGPRPSIRDRIAPLFQALRVSRRDDPSVQRDAPVVAPLSSKLPDSQPLDVRKPEGPCICHVHHPPTSTQKWYNRALLFAFIVFLLYLFINVIFLDIRIFTLSRVATRSSSVTPSASAPMMNTVTLSADTQQCIKEYTLDAPSDPTGYSCDTCLPLLTAVPSNATDVYPVARDASQFCGLRSIWEDAGEQGRAGLEAGGWVKDIKFCTWNGVRCNGAGRVSSLQLTFPAVPASLPEQITNLTWLESLKIVGNGNSPAGSFPKDFGVLTALTTLHLENTALGALPDTLQALTSLTLIRNAQLGSSLPPSIGGSALRSLIVNNEPLTLSAAQSAALCSRPLQNCDLRGTGIQACGACSVR